ncbi:MAG: hypothetical protein Kow0026_08350 [Oricola sp.]
MIVRKRGDVTVIELAPDDSALVYDANGHQLVHFIQEPRGNPPKSRVIDAALVRFAEKAADRDGFLRTFAEEAPNHDGGQDG